jgi:phosphatidylinositol glycan class S
MAATVTEADRGLVSASAEAVDGGSTATVGRKEPPPEKPSDIRRRSYVVLSLWLIVLLLGLPIWWHTTSIYRANLPLDEMMEWAEGRVSCTLDTLKAKLG